MRRGSIPWTAVLRTEAHTMSIGADTRRWIAGMSLLLSAGCSVGDNDAPVPDGFEQLPDYSSERVFSWGSGDSTDATFFFNVVGTYGLGEHVVVVEKEPPGVRYFSASGDVVSEAGKGVGPGEYARIVSAVRVPGDSLFVFDSNLLRASVLDARGSFVRLVRLTGGSSAPFLWGAPMLSADGRVEGVVVETGSYRLPGLGEPGPDPDTSSIAYYDSAGRFRHDLGHVASTFWWNDSRGRPVTVLMPTQVVWAPLEGRLVVGLGLQDELSSVDASGNWTVLYKGAATPRRYSSRERGAVVEALARESFAPESVRRSAEVTDGPREVPPYERLVADDSGRLWLGDYRDPIAPSRRWRILDPSGAPLATATLPARFLATDVRGDVVFGVAVDDLGAEKVEAWRIVGSPAGARPGGLDGTGDARDRG